MNILEVKNNLESIYSDYYDGLYLEHELKHMLNKLYMKANIPIDIWSELILDSTMERRF